MNYELQIKMIFLSFLFFLFITHMVKKKKLQIVQSLKWYFSVITFIIMAIFPKTLSFVSNLMGIIEPVNAIFMLVIAFMLIILFANNITISKNREDIVRLVQELSILKSQAKGKENAVHSVNSSIAPNGDGADSMEI